MRTHDLTTLLSLLGRRDDVDVNRCTQVLQWARGVGVAVNVFHFNSAIAAVGRRGQWRSAELLVAEMTEAGITPDVFTYNTLVSAYRKSNDVDRAFKVLERMRAQGVAPDVFTYSALICACGRPTSAAKTEPVSTAQSALGRADGERAMALFAEMRAEGLTPNLTTYNSLIAAVGGGKSPLAAVAVLRELEAHPEISPDTISYNAAITACGRVGKWELAEEVFARMRRRDPPVVPTVR
jgi:pentatricopeptide repeat protein